MSLDNEAKISHRHEYLIYMLHDENTEDYKMFIDFVHFRNIPELVKAYGVSTRTIYNIKKKNKWNERLEEFHKKSSKAYIKESINLIYRFQNKHRDNLMKMALSVQTVIENFNECIYTDPLILQQIFKKDQIEMINTVRQSTRALIDLQKLDSTIIEKLKFHGIDLSPEAIQKFEQEEILGESMLDYEFMTEDIIGNSPFKPFCPSSQIKFKEDENSISVETPEIKTTESVVEPVETPENTVSSAEIEISNDFRGGCEADGGGISETIQTQLSKTQNFIETTKKQLEELEKETVIEQSSGIYCHESSISTSSMTDDYMPNEEEEDEEKYYDEFAPENHRYPFPMEYLIPNEL